MNFPIEPLTQIVTTVVRSIDAVVASGAINNAREAVTQSRRQRELYQALAVAAADESAERSA